MKHKVKIIILSVLGVLLVGSSVAYAYATDDPTSKTPKTLSIIIFTLCFI